MEEYYQGLRSIKKRSENVHAGKWPLFFIFSIGVLGGLVFPPFGIISTLAIYLWVFLNWRLALSKCPRCGNRYYSIGNIIFGGSYYTKTRMWGVSCQSCNLALSELPEVEEVKIVSNTDEWFK